MATKKKLKTVRATLTLTFDETKVTQAQLIDQLDAMLIHEFRRDVANLSLTLHSSARRKE